MTDDVNTPALTPSLEDYLETIFELVRDRRVARVRDIARARDVKAGSVTSALHRLADMGLIRYEQREYIDLTPTGSKAALRVLSRHHLLTSFFEHVLNMDGADAERDACAMEHHLSDEAMDRLTRLFEFMRSCPNSPPDFLERFHRCARVNPEEPTCNLACGLPVAGAADPNPPFAAVADLAPGEAGRIVQVKTRGAERQGLLDQGLLPDVVLHLDRVDPSDGVVWVRVGSAQLALSPKQSRLIKIAPVTADPDGDDEP